MKGPRFGYRTIVQPLAAADNYDATTGRGLLRIHPKWQAGALQQAKSRGVCSIIPVVEIWFRTEIAPATLLLEFRDPDADPQYIDPVTGLTQNRKILFRDTTGTVTDFIEDNLGQGWRVPPRMKGDYYELQFRTTAKERRGVFGVELYWLEGYDHA